VATALGPSKRAAGPVPSALPFTPAVPASVLTAPAGVILRMVSLPLSAMNTLPALSVAMPVGSLKRAVIPAPSELPMAPGVPASVLTIPAGVILRTMLSSESTT